MIGGYYKVSFQGGPNPPIYTYRSATYAPLNEGDVVMVEVKKGARPVAIGTIVGEANADDCKKFDYVSCIVDKVNLVEVYDTLLDACKTFRRLDEQVNVLKNL